jgi:cyclopropane-fatty-acyl-phospholipid synthase
MNTRTLSANLAGAASAINDVHTARYPASGRFVLALLSHIRHGALHLQLPDGQTMNFGDGTFPVTLRLNDWTMCEAVIQSGDIGFAEAYIDAGWSTDNLTGLIELFLRNREHIESLIYGKWWGNLIYRVRHLFNRNSRKGSRKNILAHYDIGNEFYKLWLDQSMTYSSALFTNERPQSLQEAQFAKYRRILEQLNVSSGATILEIGCGWGGFAEVAISEAGANVLGLTLSAEQLVFARQRLLEAGLSDKADFQFMDYRDHRGQYDAIASIEMFEAVGEAYWPIYFESLASNLKPGGRACIQTIVIADELFARYRKGTDFIQQYIFPGGMLPSPSEFRTQAKRQGLKIIDEFAFGSSYARTLSEWQDTFRANLAEVQLQGFDDRFQRTWEFYLSYCEAAFRAENIDVMQFTLEKS